MKIQTQMWNADRIIKERNMTYLGFVECLVMIVSCPSWWCGKSCGLKPNVTAPMGCSGYIAVLLMLEDASGCLSVAASTVPPSARDWHLAPPLPPARAIWPATSGKRPQASRDLFHFVFARAPYSVPLWPKESGHLSPVRDSVDLFVPAGWINPFKRGTHSITTGSFFSLATSRCLDADNSFLMRVHKLAHNHSVGLVTN